MKRRLRFQSRNIEISLFYTDEMRHIAYDNHNRMLSLRIDTLRFYKRQKPSIDRCFSSFSSIFYSCAKSIFSPQQRKRFSCSAVAVFSFVKYMRLSRKRVIFFNGFNRPLWFWIIQSKRFKLQRIKKFYYIIHNAMREKYRITSQELSPCLRKSKK